MFFTCLADAIRAVEKSCAIVRRGMIEFPLVKSGDEWAAAVEQNKSAINYMCSEWDCSCENPWQQIVVDYENEIDPNETPADVAAQWHARIKEQKETRNQITVDDKGRVSVPRRARPMPLSKWLRDNEAAMQIGPSDSAAPVVSDPDAIAVQLPPAQEGEQITIENNSRTPIITRTDAKGNVTVDISLPADDAKKIVAFANAIVLSLLGKAPRFAKTAATVPPQGIENDPYRRLFGIDTTAARLDAKYAAELEKDLPIFNVYENGNERICTITIRLDSNQLKRKQSQVQASRNAALAFASNIRMGIGITETELQSAQAIVNEVNRCVEAAADESDLRAIAQGAPDAAAAAYERQYGISGRQEGKQAAQQEQAAALAAAGVPVLTLEPPEREQRP